MYEYRQVNDVAHFGLPSINISLNQCSLYKTVEHMRHTPLQELHQCWKITVRRNFFR